MADRQIIFSGPMVRAILDGRKTQTRRVAKITALMGNKVAVTSPDERLIELNEGEFRQGICHYESTGALSGPYSLFCSVGDRLWVREHWRTARAYDDLAPSDMGGEEPIKYEADDALQTWGWTDSFSGGRFRHGMFMPRWASRLTLIVTDVRVQRLQDISEDDARAEGVLWVPGHGEIAPADLHEGYSNYLNCREGFQVLWNSLNAARGYGWDANPWVCAVTFETHQNNIDQMEAPDA